MNNMKPVLFLDVDGTIIPLDAVNADNCVITERKIIIPAKTKTVNGFTFVEAEKVFIVEEEVTWRTPLIEFLKEIEKHVELVWLTSWKHNVRPLESTLGLQEHEWLDWELSSDESGKMVALRNFMKSRPGVKFIWADDFAPVVNQDKLTTLPENGLIIEAIPELGISDEQIAQMKKFIGV